MSTWMLTPAEHEATVARIEKVNARAAKRGFTGRISVTSEPVERTHTGATGISHTYVYLNTTITGEAPCYNGWEFLAAVDTLPAANGEDTNYVLRYAPGATVTGDDRANLAPGGCDHCHTRANRLHTYLVRNTETGALKQVGSTCIRDFTGWDGKPVFVPEDDVEREIDECTGGGGMGGELPCTVVAVAYAATREFGFAPASSYDRLPTARVVSAYLYPHNRADHELRAALAPHMDDAYEQAPAIIDTLLAELGDEAGYVANLRAALGAAYVGPRQFGLVVSAIAAYDRLMGRKARDAARPDRSQVVHQGTVGGKITVTGAITRCQGIDTAYGLSLLILIENDTTVVKTFTTAAWAWDDSIDVGTEVTVTGTVKAHDEYRDVKQTVLTRTKRTDA